MNGENEKYRNQVEEQQELLLTHLARLGVTIEYDIDVPIPAEETPLAQLFMATKLVAENLAMVASERDKSFSELQQKLQLIQRQSQAILELSTPVIQVWDEILALPLIGTVDTQRAQQIIENLLEAIVRKSASVVIMDITGVPVVDTKVANHFIKTIDAARMLGAEVILTGVSPHNAQTLVKLGVNLSRMTTKGSLQAGLKLAFEMTKNKVVKES